MPPIISLAAPLGSYTFTKGAAARDFETKLVRHAACTIAGIKPANLFTWRAAGFTDSETDAAFAELSARLEHFGIRLERMARRETGALVLAWRPAHVAQALSSEHARRVLQAGGFAEETAEGVIAQLKARIAEADAARLARVAAGSEPAAPPKPEPFVPCCAQHGEHGGHHKPGHVCQCRAKAAIAREEAEATQGEAEFPHEIGLLLGYPPADVEGFIQHKGADFAACGGWKAYESPSEALKTFQEQKRCTLEMVEMHAQGAPLEMLAGIKLGGADIVSMARAV